MSIEALSIAIQTQSPVLLWGSPGVGKTATVLAIGAALKWPVEVVIASVREPSDFAGLPVVVNGGVNLHPPSWATRLVAAKKGILFLDEITTAAPATQAALLRVVLDRVVGDVALPETIAIVAAANPPEQASGGWDLTAPLANRFCHLSWALDYTVWVDGMVSGWPLPSVRRLPKAWEARLPQARASVAAYIRHRPANLLQVPQEDAPAGQAWPSPRSWSLAARLLAASEDLAVETDTAATLLAGCVGDGPALEFLQWRATLDLPDPEEVLQHPTALQLPERGDRAYAVLSAVAAAIVAQNTPERWQAGWQVMAHAYGQTPDIAASACRTLIKNRPHGTVTPPKEAAVFAPLLRDAGLM